jgi:methyltransferase family protein
MIRGQLLREALPPELAALPALVEPVERRLLYNLARHHYQAAGAIVELGAFLGGSAASLAAGLRDNPSAGESPRVHTFDCFECSTRGALAPALHALLRQHRLDHSLVRYDDRLDFEDCFLQVIEPYGQWINPTRAFLSDVRWDSPIEMLHIDLPKDYAQLRYVKQRFFPHLLSGAIVIHQDFVYHWSGELIAATVAFIERGILRVEALFGTSLVLTTVRETRPEDLAWLEQRMADPLEVAAHIERAIALYKGAPFVKAILSLALAQQLISNHQAERGEKLLSDLLADPQAAKFRGELERRIEEMARSHFRLNMS